MRVIGTAGHVDHGKSTLIAALTGTHPDRLKEEREREMTIELGFGWLTLPGGEEVGIVDVPGHRDFIENMLAGVGGIDAALLVIAADEGVMPQTREHLAILDLLQIQNGLIVITKTDLVDADWLGLIEEEVRATLLGTTLRDAPLVCISAKLGLGLDRLLSTLENILPNTPPRLDLARPRLPIDRVFSMPGFGTVVTGTLSDGRLNVGDEVEILPTMRRGRVRGLQTHKKKEESAAPGSRTAVNISGIAVDEITRGQVMATPGHYVPTRRIDARLRLLPDASAALKHAAQVKVFIGAAESMATLRLLGVETLTPGQEEWVQLELRDPLVTAQGDRFIVRRPSPSETLGGGQVVDAHPTKRHRRFDQPTLGRLASLAHGSPEDIYLQASLSLGPASITDVTKRSGLDVASAQTALAGLLSHGRIHSFEGSIIIANPHWQALVLQIQSFVESYHKQYPLRHGMPKEELKSKLRQSPKIFNLVIKKLTLEKLLNEENTWVASPSHKIQFSVAQQNSVNRLLAEYKRSPYATPSIKDSQALVGDEVFAALVDSGEVVPVSPEVAFLKTDYEFMVTQVRAALGYTGQLTAAEVRDLFNTSRKYALALLEHLDAIGVTIRDGDYRKLKT